jgi:excinuclease ABC subunit A
LVFHDQLSIEEGAVDLWEGRYAQYVIEVIKSAMAHYGVPLTENLPLREYSPAQKVILYHGTESRETEAFFPRVTPPKTVEEGKFEGVIPGMWRRLSEKSGQSAEADKYFYSECCPKCHGERLNPLSREVKVGGKRIPELVKLSLSELDSWIHDIGNNLDQEMLMSADAFIKDIRTKIKRIIRTGLGYLSLDRQTISLSGGETQRLKLAALLDSSLTGIMYVMDEPTFGLHPRDTMQIVSVLKELRDMGNSVLVIEHDTGIMKEADYIIDFGPGAGKAGGMIVGQGTLEELKKQPESVTGRYLQHEETIKKVFRKGIGEPITIRHATVHNLKDVTVSLPASCLIAITGVSGSGKSSLIFDVLAKGKDYNHGGCGEISGLERFDRIVSVDQIPVNRMSRSNVATFIDVFTEIRKVFSKTPMAVQKGLEAKHFSFNTSGGRCENCEGMGYVTTSMLFFPDLEVTCPVCHGKRFKPEVLEIKYQGSSINDVLDFTVSESLQLFKQEKRIVEILKLLDDFGLGYVNLGQSLTTLSDGEGQRLKLAKELLRKTDRPVLYLLDEPTTGLHPVDIGNLLNMLNILVDAGNTVVVVEHNIQLIRNADYIIDLGPEGGELGGTVVAKGTPKEIAANIGSYTGRYI